MQRRRIESGEDVVVGVNKFTSTEPSPLTEDLETVIQTVDPATEAAATKMLEAHPDLVGIYNLGAGNAGLVAALGKTHRAGNIRVVAHELSDTTRGALRAGTLDVVLDQNPDGEIRAAIAAARQVALSPDAQVHSEPIEIGIFLRDNLR